MYSSQKIKMIIINKEKEEKTTKQWGMDHVDYEHQRLNYIHQIAYSQLI